LSNAYLLIRLRKALFPELFTESRPRLAFRKADAADEEELSDNHRHRLGLGVLRVGHQESHNIGIFCTPKESIVRTDYVERALRFVKVARAKC
jgi:hypothetical protein